MGRRSFLSVFATFLRTVTGMVMALALVAAPAGAAGLVTPAPGSLDTSFASVGYLTNDMIIRNMVVQPDHKIVVAGQVWGRTTDETPVFGVYRYLPNGTLDPTFGSGGEVVMKPAVTGSSIGLARQSDGKLVVSGQLNERVSVVRLRANGALDLSFSGDGVAYLNADGTGENVRVDPTGKIDVLRNDLDDAPSVMQLNPNGTLNKAFGKGGIAPLGCQFGQGLVLQGSQILVAGSFVNAGSDFCVERLQSGGTPSPTFGNKGVSHGGFSRSAGAYGITFSATYGTITAVGTVQGATPRKSYTALARFHLNGTLDTSFGTGGRVTTTDRQLGIRSRGGVGNAVAMDGADTLLAGATNSSQWLLARYTANGSLDKTFGTDGRVSSFSSEATANAVRVDGSKIVVGGYYNPDEELDDPPDGGIARYYS